MEPTVYEFWCPSCGQKCKSYEEEMTCMHPGTTKALWWPPRRMIRKFPMPLDMWIGPKQEEI